MPSKAAFLLLSQIGGNYAIPYKLMQFGNKTVFYGNNEKASNYLIVSRGIKELTQLIDMLKMTPQWNSGSKFLVILMQQWPNQEKFAKDIIEILHTATIWNPIIMLPTTKDEGIFFTYAMYPFKATKNKILHINSCQNGVFSTKTFYKNQLPKNMSNITVKSMYHYAPPYVIEDEYYQLVRNSNPGIAVNLVKLISEILNFKLTLASSNSTPGEVFINGTVSKELKKLKSTEVQLLVGSYVMTYPKMLYFDCSIPFISDKYVWCVPNYAIPALKYDSRIPIFSGLTFSSIVLIIWYVNRQTVPGDRFYKSFANLIQSSFSILLGISVRRLPKSGKLRYIFALHIIFAYYLTTLYMSTLTRKYLHNKTVQKYDSLKKIYENNLTTYFMTNSFKYMVNIDEVPEYVIESRKIDCDDWLKCIQDVTLGDSAFLLKENIANYLLSSLKENRTKIHCFTFIDNISVILLMKKGYLLTNHFNHIINKVLENGFTKIWQRYFFNNYQNDQVDLKPRKIKLKSLFWIFRAFSLGCLISNLVFLGEIVVFYKC
ncbi:unnamed protein product [Psylliodes chrysocephalus]|uniref:Uncharacterized protein n=1 Tax=Psylliodes chrysocephalus TaxID=3402493 RepID=A0A9P0D6S3_9CUCU|nr:unnamed protein product [Psylliodes chrysocephala]